MSNKTLGLRFGAMADPIHNQLKEQGFVLLKESTSKYQKIHDSLIMLRLHGIVPLSEIQQGEKRLLNMVAKEIKSKYA